MRQAIRTHPSESSDSEAVQCPECGGDGVKDFKGAELDCDVCCKTGFLLRQRMNDHGVPERVTLTEKKNA